MVNSREKDKKQKNIKENRESWPTWFIKPANPIEWEMLSQVLNSDKRLNEIYFTVQMMPTNFLIFKKNYEELINLLEKFNNLMFFAELALDTDESHKIAYDASLEFTRLLHNFLASVTTLIDLTRTWAKKLFEGTKFMKVYEAEIAQRFTNNIQANFLKDLRNFTLHRTLPLSSPELRFRKTGKYELRSSLGIVLIKEYLLEWKKWSVLGKMQLDIDQENKVDIRPIIEAYYQSVTNFTQWLSWEMRDLFTNEVGQINHAINSKQNN